MTVVAAAAGDDGRRGMRLQTGRGRNGGIHAKRVKKGQNMAPWVRLQTESSTFFHRLS